MIIDFKHLDKSTRASKLKFRNGVHKYIWHWCFAMKEAAMLFWLAIKSVVHAFLPFLYGWSLLEEHVRMLKYTKSKVPDNATMRKVHFKDLKE